MYLFSIFLGIVNIFLSIKEDNELIIISNIVIVIVISGKIYVDRLFTDIFTYYLCAVFISIFV